LDNNYQTYLNRVMRLTLPETYVSQVQHIQESPKFSPRSELDYQPVLFPGYSVITPPWESESKNSDVLLCLKNYQQELVQKLPAGLLIPLPPESFHLTLADLIWDSAYREAKQNPEFESNLQQCIARSFQQYQSSLAENRPIQLQIVGLMVMPRAIAVCLIPREEDAYERILKFRRAIYQNPELIALGIEQQYHFTAHITLGYFGKIPTDLDRALLGETFNELNHQWLEVGKQDFWIHRAELRKFDDMTHYYREPDFPVFEF
jgi:2'-5' RNA ligase